MNLPTKAWLYINNSNKQWSISVPNGRMISRYRILSGCTGQQIPVQIESTPIKKTKQRFQIHLKPHDAENIRIGPLIGILSVAKGMRLLGNRANFIDIINAGKQHGAIVFVFTPHDLHWDILQVNGRFYDFEAKRWSTYTIPFPDVVYNRVPNRDYEADPFVADTIRRLQVVPNLHLYNPHFFDKWELFQILQNSDVYPHLPDTLRISNPQMLLHLLNKHTILYLKPTSGKAGNGIYRLGKNGEGIHIQSSFNKKKKYIQMNSIGQLWRFLQPIVEREPYIAQQAISLLTYENKPFDVRILVQKNGIGEWEVSGVGFRAAGNGGITTHVPQGGKIIYRSSALDPYFGAQESEQLLTKIKETAIKVASRLDDHYQALGEMSMDFGVTKDGTIWFFEANAKPMKFDEPEIRSTSLRRIIEYSKYLSQFT